MENEKTILDEMERNEKGQYLFKLKRPVQYGDKLIEVIELDEPKAKHIRQLPTKPKMGDILIVVGKLCQQPDSFVDELGMGDVTRLGEYIEAFS